MFALCVEPDFTGNRPTVDDGRNIQVLSIYTGFPDPQTTLPDFLGFDA